MFSELYNSFFFLHFFIIKVYRVIQWNQLIWINNVTIMTYSEKKKNWSPADFVRLPTDKEMISL